MIRNLKRTGNDDIDIFINSRRRVSNGLGEHGIIFCEHEHFDFLSSTSSEHFDKTQFNSIQFFICTIHFTDKIEKIT